MFKLRYNNSEKKMLNKASLLNFQIVRKMSLEQSNKN